MHATTHTHTHTHTHTANNRNDRAVQWHHVACETTRQLHHAACSTTIVERVFATGRERCAARSCLTARFLKCVQRMAEQVSARCTLCTPAPSTPPSSMRACRLDDDRSPLRRAQRNPYGRDRLEASTPSRPHPARATIAHSPMPITLARQALARSRHRLRPGRPPAVAAPGGIPYSARAATAHTPMHATRDRPTRARARRRPAQEHFTPIPCYPGCYR